MYPIANLGRETSIVAAAAAARIGIVAAIEGVAIMKPADTCSIDKNQHGDKGQPYDKIHSYIGTRMHWSWSAEANDDVRNVPDQGQGQRRSQQEKPEVEVAVSILQSWSSVPNAPSQTKGDDSTDDGQQAKDEFGDPQSLRFLHSCARRAIKDHDCNWFVERPELNVESSRST